MEYNSDINSDSSVESWDSSVYDNPICMCFVDTTMNWSTVCEGGNKFRIEDEMEWNFKCSGGMRARYGPFQGFELPRTDRVFFAGTFFQNMKRLYRMGYQFKFGSVFGDVELGPIYESQKAQIEFCTRNYELMGCDVKLSTPIQDMHFAIILLH
jgi:hypothetical protein